MSGDPPARRPGEDVDGDHDGGREITPSEIEAHEESLPEPGEHDFEPDVERIHRPLFREPRGPVEGREPPPWWLWAITATALFWGGWYLGRFGGHFGATAHEAFAVEGAYVAEEAAKTGVEATVEPVRAGMQIYASRCQPCHQPTGLGVPGVFPPLIGSEWVTGPPEVPVMIVLNGLHEPVVVAGASYNGAMPAWRDVLSDTEIAAVITYIRQWGTNEAPPVAPDLVARLREATAQRQGPWTIAELRQAVQGAAIRRAVEAAAAGGAPAPTGGEPAPTGGEPAPTGGGAAPGRGRP